MCAAKGRVFVAVSVAKGDFAFAERFAEREGYLNAADFFQAVFTPALLSYREEFEDLLTAEQRPPANREEDEDLVIAEDDGGHASLAGARPCLAILADDERREERRKKRKAAFAAPRPF
jgi:hypothetical protein